MEIPDLKYTCQKNSKIQKCPQIATAIYSVYDQGNLSKQYSVSRLFYSLGTHGQPYRK